MDQQKYSADCDSRDSHSDSNVEKVLKDSEGDGDMHLQKGDLVGIPVTYAKGAFADEFLVYIKADGTIMSGFARRMDLKFVDDTNAQLRARVLDVGDEVRLKVYGSFFTTNGIEPVQADWARKNLVAA